MRTVLPHYLEYFSALLIFFGALFLFNPASAAVLDLDKINKIPQYGEEYPEKEFRQNSRPYRVKTKGNEHLEFMVRIPDDWKRSYSDLTAFKDSGTALDENTGHNNMIDTRLLGKIARFLGPARMDHISFLEVEVMELEFNISLKNWLLNYVMNKGITLQGMREVNENRYEILFNKVENAVPYVVRMITEVSGSRILMAAYYLPEKYWNEERGQQQRVINSIDLLNPKKRQIEDSATYQFLDLVRFEYPVSWKLLAPNIYSTDAMEARIINSTDDEALDGEIRMTILSTDMDVSMAEEISLIREDLQKMSIDIDRLKVIDDIDLDLDHYDHIFWKKIEIYDTRRGQGREIKRDYEFWLGIFIEDRYYYLITMLTPTREKDFFNWARNMEAYKTVVGSIRP